MRRLHPFSPKQSAACHVLGLALVSTASAQDRDLMVLHDDDGLTVRAHLQAGLNLVGEQDLFWSLADIFAPTARYNPDKVWLEGYVKPGVRFRRGLSVDLSAGARELKLGTGMLFANDGSSGFERGALRSAGLVGRVYQRRHQLLSGLAGLCLCS